MGLLIDSAALISAERKELSPEDLLDETGPRPVVGEL